MRYKKFLIFFLSFILLVVFLFWIIFNTSIGKNLLKIYFQKEIDTYFPGIKIEKLVVTFNNFSMTLKDNKNFYKLYGQIFPFDAILEGNMKEFIIGGKKFKENIILSGHVLKKNKSYLITSNVYFDDSVGFLNVNLSKRDKKINFVTNNVDIKYFFNKFSIPYIKGLDAKVELNALNYNNNYIVAVQINGKYKNNILYSKIKFTFNSFNNILLKGMIESKVLEGNFNANLKNNFIYNSNFNKFDLSLVDLIFPFRGIVSLELKKDESDIIKFSSNHFKGFKDKDLNIEFSMPVEEFFYHVNLDNIFSEGIVTGRFLISKKGFFNFIIQKAKLKTKIAKKLKVINNYFDKIFVKGSFDRKKVIFNLLTDNKNLTINIKNGHILIKNNLIPSFVVIINNLKEKKYYKFYNKKLKLIKRKILENNNNKILVL